MTMHQTTVRAFVNEMEKLAISPQTKWTPELRASRELDQIQSGKPNWKAFEKDMKRSSSFRSVVVKSSKADEKLRRYTEAMGEYLSSKKVLARVPSRTTRRDYAVKELRDGRLGCGCKDWQYKHSHNGSDCDHIREVSDLRKTGSAVRGVLASALATNRVQRSSDKGKDVKQTVKAVHQKLGW
jgi:hypothetical protein